MNTRNALTDAEKTLILREYTAGASLDSTRLALHRAGFVRGTNTISDYLASMSLPLGHKRHRQSHDSTPHTHSCVFCSWRGAFADYYGHWRTMHRRRAGYTHTELTGERPRA